MDLIAEHPQTTQLRGVLAQVRSIDPHAPGLTDADRATQLRLQEEIKAASAGAQVRTTVAFASSQEQDQRDAGVRPDKVGLGVGSQVALAKRESPFRGNRFVQFSKVVLREMPCTYAVLAAGRTTEHRATIVVKETIWLSAEHRAEIDAEIAPLLEKWGDAEVEREVKKRAYRLDPRGFVERSNKAAQDRTVTLRPAPETMTFLTGHLPVGQGVAVFAALTREADAARAAGDERTRGQIMADTLVERVTGQASAEAVPLAVGLVMSDQTMLNTGDHSDEPAHVEGYGPIPADLARQLLLAADAEADVWVQRLFKHPETGELAAIESQAQFFRGALRKLLVARDQFCRTPYCGARIRHGDHAVDRADGGPTSAINGQGLCEACNYAKTALAWRALALLSGQHTVLTVTPTGHRYLSRAPDPPRTADPPPRRRPQVDYMWPPDSVGDTA